MKPALRNRLLVAALILTPFASPVAKAAEITWETPFVVTAATDISNPIDGQLVVAADFNSAAGTAVGDDNTINGIPFTETPTAGAGTLTTTMTNGPSYNTGFFTGTTDDGDLDALLDSHSWLGGNPGTTSFTVATLTPGATYQIQLIAVADARSCCAGRTYEPDDGQGNFTTGVTLQRGLFQSVIGTFIADASSQTIGWRSLNDAAGNNDPGLSGFVLIEINTDDTDNDGLLDNWELLYNLDPNEEDSDGDGTLDGEEDEDMDGLDNLEEQDIGTNPTLDDSDDDGLLDGVEDRTGTWAGPTATGTNPLVDDSDGDDLLDGVETNTGIYVDPTQTGSDPNIFDTDMDGLPDGIEVAISLDPSVTDTDNNGTLDGDEDADMDRLSNAVELALGTMINDPDTDADNLIDGVETNTGIYVSPDDTGTNPLTTDFDGDGVLDGDEVNGTSGFVTVPTRRDTDRDGAPDGIEIAQLTDPTNPADRPALAPVEVIAGLLGGDLTDVDDDGMEGPTDPGPPQTAGTGFDWLSVFASSEEYFHNTSGVGEGAFDIFDNTVGAAGAKWCCDGPPQSATVEFEEPVSLTHFTLSSGNDVPDRDPLDWQILGSQDGVNFEPIYTQSDNASLWATGERNTTIRFVLPSPSVAYSFLRYEVTRTGGTQHQLNEIEYFGSSQSPDRFRIVDITIDSATGEFSVTWNSVPGRFYGLYYSVDLIDWGADVNDNIEAIGDTTTFTFPNPLPDATELYFRVELF